MTQCDLILQALKAADGQWVSMPQLAEAGESLNVDEGRVLAWTAITDCVVGKHAVP